MRFITSFNEYTTDVNVGECNVKTNHDKNCDISHGEYSYRWIVFVNTYAYTTYTPFFVMSFSQFIVFTLFHAHQMNIALNTINNCKQLSFRSKTWTRGIFQYSPANIRHLKVPGGVSDGMGEKARFLRRRTLNFSPPLHFRLRPFMRES